MTPFQLNLRSNQYCWIKPLKKNNNNNMDKTTIKQRFIKALSFYLRERGFGNSKYAARDRCRPVDRSNCFRCITIRCPSLNSINLGIQYKGRFCIGWEWDERRSQHTSRTFGSILPRIYLSFRNSIVFYYKINQHTFVFCKRSQLYLPNTKKGRK